MPAYESTNAIDTFYFEGDVRVVEISEVMVVDYCGTFKTSTGGRSPHTLYSKFEHSHFAGVSAMSVTLAWHLVIFPHQQVCVICR